MNQSHQVRFNDLLHVAKLDYLYKYTSAENGLLLIENKQLHFNSPLNSMIHLIAFKLYANRKASRLSSKGLTSCDPKGSDSNNL